MKTRSSASGSDSKPEADHLVVDVNRLALGRGRKPLRQGVGQVLLLRHRNSCARLVPVALTAYVVQGYTEAVQTLQWEVPMFQVLL